MADLPEVVVTGQPLSGDPFSLDLLPFFATDNSVAQYREWTAEELGLPAVLPVQLPEIVNVVPKVGPVTPPSLPANKPIFGVLPAISSGVASALGGLLGLVFPQPTGPAKYDEAPSPSPGPEIYPVDVVSTPLPYGLSPLAPIFIEVPNVGIPFEPGSYGYPGAEPGPALDPFSPLGVPDLVPGPGTLPDAPGSAAPTPSSRPAPDLFPSPFPDPWGDPLRNPNLAPEPVPRTVPEPARPPREDIRTPFEPLIPDLTFSPRDPVPTPTGDPFSLPGLGPGPGIPLLLEPTPEPVNEPVPREEEDPDCCKRCAKKKEKKKKRKPRSICYRGTYVQRAKGISYRKIEQVPCESSPMKRLSRKPKLKPGQFPSTALTGEQWVDLGTQAMKEFYPIISDWWRDRQAKKKPPAEPKTKAKKPRKKRNRKAKTTPGRTGGGVVPILTTPF